jgi:hypothetical protein
LEDILKSETQLGVPRQVFLLTDGVVDDPTSCVIAVKKHANSTRVFTFGIGQDVSKDLVENIARAGNGDCCLIKSVDSSNIEETVLQQLNKALKPALTNVSIC